MYFHEKQWQLHALCNGNTNCRRVCYAAFSTALSFSLQILLLYFLLLCNILALNWLHILCTYPSEGRGKAAGTYDTPRMKIKISRILFGKHQIYENQDSFLSIETLCSLKLHSELPTPLFPAYFSVVCLHFGCLVDGLTTLIGHVMRTWTWFRWQLFLFIFSACTRTLLLRHFNSGQHQLQLQQCTLPQTLNHKPYTLGLTLTSSRYAREPLLIIKPALISELAGMRFHVRV